MTIDIITLFPNLFESPFSESIIKRALEKNLVKINIHDLRNWTKDKHKTADDRPFGGGVGMVLKPEPIFEAVETVKGNNQNSKVILLSPQGKHFTQQKAQEYSTINQLILICGRYEGVDERVKLGLIDEEISIGDYVLTGGELPAMVVTDALVRLLPGVLGTDESSAVESFSYLDKLTGRPLLDHPQYTQPREFRGMEVPEVLLSGDHKKIDDWRLSEARKKTAQNRPDLL